MASVQALMIEARECYQEGRHIQADKLYTDALDILIPHQDTQKLLQAKLYNERGVCRYKQVNFDEAVQDYTQALELDPSLASAYYNRATISYRLIASHPRGSQERKDLVQQALRDFQEAVRRDPSNIEFKEGCQRCKDEIETDDGDMKVLKLDTVPLAKLVKLLYLLDNGDRETGTTQAYKNENAAAAQKAKEVFQLILRSREDGRKEITRLLQSRAKTLLEYVIFTLPEGFNDLAIPIEAGWSDAMMKQDEDLLILAEGCHYLGIEYLSSLDEKIEKVQKKMELEKNEKDGNFFIYAENLLMNWICDTLTPDLVYKLFQMFVKKYGKHGFKVDSDLVKEETHEDEGVKEALFFFVIRVMEEHKLLNRIYTDKLQELMEDCGRHEDLCKVISSLKTYPEQCQPAGLCIIFCVTEKREGACSEIVKIQSVFEDRFKFTVKIKKNPSCSTFDEYKKELSKTKYRFYDSLVIWFVSHGDETKLILAEEQDYNREKFIDDFSNLSNFNKKPKIFFMATCRGNKPIRTNNSDGENSDPDCLRTGQDGKKNLFDNVALGCLDLSTIYYQMDRLVAYATLPSNISFRLKDEGSVFVDTVCSLLEEHQGENITQVLEGVSRLIHQLVFKSDEDQFDGKSKQACYYESTFQKTFLVPRPPPKA